MTFGPGNCTNVSVGPGGDRLLFIGDGDILENGSSGKRLFALDFKQDFFHVVYQITARGTIFPPVSASLGTWFAHLRVRRRRRRDRRLREADLPRRLRSRSLLRGRQDLASGRPSSASPCSKPAPGSPDLALRRRRRVHDRHVQERHVLQPCDRRRRHRVHGRRPVLGRRALRSGRVRRAGRPRLRRRRRVHRRHLRRRNRLRPRPTSAASTAIPARATSAITLEGCGHEIRRSWTASAAAPIR